MFLVHRFYTPFPMGSIYTHALCTYLLYSLEYNDKTFHPALKLTFEITETQLPFVDILLSITGDSISTSIYYKAADAHNSLNYSSSHPIKLRHILLSLSFSVCGSFAVMILILNAKRKK